MAQGFMGLLSDCSGVLAHSVLFPCVSGYPWLGVGVGGQGLVSALSFHSPHTPSYLLPGSSEAHFCIQAPPRGHRSGLLILVQLWCPAESWQQGDAEKTSLDRGDVRPAFDSSQERAPILKVGWGTEELSQCGGGGGREEG